MINKNALLNFDSNIENQNLLHINRLPARATIVPAQKRGIYYRNKFDSTLIKSLDGDYKFKYLAEDTEKDFYLKSVDDTDWDIIDVPSMWQYRGYGKPEYPNIRYPFPFLPPYIKKQNPVGLYRKVFKIDNPAEHTILHFAGVDNAFYVYLNGEMIGFSKGSRIPAEFDVSEKIVKGHNLLCVKVFTYSDASYLENQDMLLASGIFRNVFLIENVVVNPYFSIKGMLYTEPMDSALNLGTFLSLSVACNKVSSTQKLYNIATLVLNNLVALYDIAAHESYLALGLQALEAGDRFFHKVTSFNVNLICKGQLSNSKLRLFGMV